MEQITPQTDKKLSLKDRLLGMSKKTIILLAAGAVLLVTAGFIAAEVYENKLERLENQLEQQAKMIQNGSQTNQQVASSASRTRSDASSTSTESANAAATTATAGQSASSAYGIPLVETSELDGTYTATVGNDQYVLTVKGNQASLTETDYDGDQDMEQVIFDLDKKIAYVDGEAETYTVSGNTLTFTEIDNNLFQQDTITFTRQ